MGTSRCATASHTSQHQHFVHLLPIGSCFLLQHNVSESILCRDHLPPAVNKLWDSTDASHATVLIAVMQDPAAKVVHKAFLEGLKAHNKAVVKRNASSASAARAPKLGGRPCTALLTDSPPNVTGRGVPTSPSI